MRHDEQYVTEFFLFLQTAFPIDHRDIYKQSNAHALSDESSSYDINRVSDIMIWFLFCFDRR